LIAYAPRPGGFGDDLLQPCPAHRRQPEPPITQACPQWQEFERS
jgi:hypothetical protein